MGKVMGTSMGKADGQGGASGRPDVVVVGSGFGGSIAALRLAQAGRSVAVLERGRRWAPGQFPRDVTRTDEVLWRPRARASARGLFDVRFLSGVGAVVASGVGGGSLVYANIHVRPDAAVFDDPRWPRAYSRAALEPYFDRVDAELRPAPVPASLSLRKRDAFLAAAARMGRAAFDPPEAVAWDGSPGPGRSACTLCAECEFGCQVGAKQSMDLTYLARAEALGAQVRPHAEASHVEPVPGGWRVHYRDLEGGRMRSVEARRVVLAAGTLGTVEVLLRSRAHGLKRLSPRLGHGFSGNGDFLGSVAGAREDLEPWRGPDVTSVMRFTDAPPHFTLAAPTFNRAVTEVLAGMGQPRLGPLQGAASPLWTRLAPLLERALAGGWLAKPLHAGADASRALNLFAIGRDNANGRMGLTRDGGLDVTWDWAGENRALVERMTAAMQELASQLGGRFAPLVTWELFRRPFTVHALGGAALAEDPSRGVVSPEGEVFHQPGLYVADGAAIPTSIGFHPVMTISAVAERVAEAVAHSF
jgi:cholesterol oxidase